MLKKLGLTFLILSLVPFLLYWMKAEGLAGVSVGDYLEKRNTILMPTIVANPEIKWTQADEDKRIALERAKENISVKATHKVSKPALDPVEVKIDMKGNCTSKVRQDLVNHAYKISGGDMKFIGTIASESMYDVNSIGDGGDAIGLCQFNRLYQPDNHREYQKLQTDFQKLEFCHEKYSIWKKKGVLSTRLYGSNVWKKGIQKLQIVCK